MVESHALLGVILAAIVYLLVYCYEGIIIDLIAWTWHKWKDRKDQQAKEID